jgi:hypothetical protein
VPGQFGTAIGVLQLPQGNLPERTADLVFRFRNAHHQNSLLGSLGGLAKGLGERELRVECPGRQRHLVAQLTGISDPFVDKDQAGCEPVEQFLQCVAGVGAFLVVVLDHLVTGLAARLPGQLAPEGADHGAVGLLMGLARRDLGADRNGPVDTGGHRHSSLFY